MEKELIAKVKFWFGKDEPIFRNDLEVEYNDNFAYIYRITLEKGDKVI